jgi:hypothetical protein
MRKLKEITAEEENFRVEELKDVPGISVLRRDSIEPEPVGTIVLMPFRIIGYDRDCDGSLMARLVGLSVCNEKMCDSRSGRVDRGGRVKTNTGLYPENTLVVTEEELVELLK